MVLALKKHNGEHAYHSSSPSLPCFWLVLEFAFSLGQIQEPVTNHEIYTGFWPSFCARTISISEGDGQSHDLSPAWGSPFSASLWNETPTVRSGSRSVWGICQWRKEPGRVLDWELETLFHLGSATDSLHSPRPIMSLLLDLNFL